MLQSFSASRAHPVLWMLKKKKKKPTKTLQQQNRRAWSQQFEFLHLLLICYLYLKTSQVTKLSLSRPLIWQLQASHCPSNPGQSSWQQLCLITASDIFLVLILHTPLFLPHPSTDFWVIWQTTTKSVNHIGCITNTSKPQSQPPASFLWSHSDVQHMEVS